MAVLRRAAAIDSVREEVGRFAGKKLEKSFVIGNGPSTADFRQRHFSDQFLPTLSRREIFITAQTSPD